ncbi:MAG: YbaB/EbfC family nucleoid-associated protein [Candidatus Coatesbacteria bacterium]|nr:MAG: YbaB/EbfC family nucleoid-associated protein [Candidatus Coatesbacteria bacterium]
MFRNLGDMAGLLTQAKKFEKEMKDLNERLGWARVEGDAGGGMVRVVCNGRQDVLSVEIDPAIVDPSETAMLEELILAAVNTARRKAQELAKEEMEKLARDMGVPPGLLTRGAMGA